MDPHFFVVDLLSQEMFFRFQSQESKGDLKRDLYPPENEENNTYIKKLVGNLMFLKKIINCYQKKTLIVGKLDSCQKRKATTSTEFLASAKILKYISLKSVHIYVLY